MIGRMPQIVHDIKRQQQMLASVLGVSVSAGVRRDGLYVALRSRRDPINTNRKRKYLTVRLILEGEERYRSEEEVKSFPTEFLITKLMLVI